LRPAGRRRRRASSRAFREGLDSAIAAAPAASSVCKGARRCRAARARAQLGDGASSRPFVAVARVRWTVSRSVSSATCHRRAVTPATCTLRLATRAAGSGGSCRSGGSIGRAALLIAHLRAAVWTARAAPAATAADPPLSPAPRSAPSPSRRPKEIKEIRDFLHVARRKDARQVKIMKSVVKVKGAAPTAVTKFKVRCSKYLYTLSVKDAEKADKLKSSLPPGASCGAAAGRGGSSGGRVGSVVVRSCSCRSAPRAG